MKPGRHSGLDTRSKPSRRGYDWLRICVLVLVILLFLIVLGLRAPRFFTMRNVTNIVLQSSITAIVALGLTLPILTGGIDLSVGSTAALAGTVSAGLIARGGWTSGAAVAAALLIGAGVGLVIGLLVVGGKLPPFVASLTMLAVGRGLTLVYTEGRAISGLPEGYRILGGGTAIPLPIVFLIVIACFMHFLLTQTRFGHNVYAVGGNADTARLAGISVGKVTVMVYVISGITAAFAGILLTARLWSAQPTAGVGLELDAIAAVVLGRVSLMGGSGHAGAPLVGALIVGVIGNALNYLKIQSYLQQVINGLILIIAVMIDINSRRSRTADARTAAEVSIAREEKHDVSNADHL